MIKMDLRYVFMCLTCITSVLGWTSWSNWSPCSSSCGTGRQYKYRSCTSCSYEYCCSGAWTSWTSCTGYQCPVNGGWSLWLTWGSCSSSCDGGTRYRSRKCNNPVPNYGGSYCIGLPYENDMCNTKKCQVNGGWNVWLTWGSCSSSCDGGTRYRSRNCNNPVPNYDGSYCTGLTYENGMCNTKRCPVNGQWNMWSNWTICDTTCGEGYQNRSRSCDSPAPDYGGFNCGGSTTDVRQCYLESCAERIMAEDTCCSVGVVTGAVIGSIILTGVALVLVHVVWRRRGNKEKNQQTSEERRKDYLQHNPSYISSDQKVKVLHQEETDNTGFEQDVYENLKI